MELGAQDLSHGGLFLPTTAAFESDRELELFLRSTVGEISVRAQIVQVISCERAAAENRAPGYGLLFIDLDQTQRVWIGLTLDALHRTQDAIPLPDLGLKAVAPVVAASPAARSSELDAECKRALQKLQAQLISARERTPWDVLGVRQDAPVDVVRSAFHALSKRSHPHAYAHLDDPEVSRIATELFITHKRAYDTLMRQAPAVQPIPIAPLPRPSLLPPAKPKRRDADKTIPLGPWTAAPPVITPMRPPEVRSPRAATLPGMPSKRKRAAEAELAIAEGLKHLAASRFDAACAALEHAQDVWPEDDTAARWLLVAKARRFRARGEEAEALQTYRTLLAIDPEHREAREQLGGTPKEAKRSGLMGKLFGSNE